MKMFVVVVVVVVKSTYKKNRFVVPLIESGTAGYLGQTSVIFGGDTGTCKENDEKIENWRNFLFFLNCFEM
jgi:hypothetical protein